MRVESPAFRVAAQARGETARRVLRDALLGASWLGALFMLVVAAVGQGSGDRTMYYNAPTQPLYQGLTFPNLGLYYSPVAARFMLLFSVLPLDVFLVLFALVGCVAVAWLVAPLGWRWAPQAFLLVLPVTLHGNMEWLVALIAVYAFRWPALWAVILLTKLTPGVGVLWFAVRREWRALAITLGVTGVLVSVSVAGEPGLWAAWISMLLANSGARANDLSMVPISPFVRIAIAALIVVWGARTSRPWAMVPAIMLARVDLLWPELAVLVALPRLVTSPQSEYLEARNHVSGDDRRAEPDSTLAKDEGPPGLRRPQALARVPRRERPLGRP